MGCVLRRGYLDYPQGQDCTLLSVSDNFHRLGSYECVRHADYLDDRLRLVGLTCGLQQSLWQLYSVASGKVRRLAKAGRGYRWLLDTRGTKL